jgi:hypothetical protein
MATEGLTLRNPFEGGHAPSEVQLKQYEKAYRELKTEIITEDKEFSAKQVPQPLPQTHKLKGSLESLRDIATKAVSNRQECEVKIVHVPSPRFSSRNNPKSTSRRSANTTESSNPPTTRKNSEIRSLPTSSSTSPTVSEESRSPRVSMLPPSRSWKSKSASQRHMKSSSGSWLHSIWSQRTSTTGPISK